MSVVTLHVGEYEHVEFWFERKEKMCGRDESESRSRRAKWTVGETEQEWWPSCVVYISHRTLQALCFNCVSLVSTFMFDAYKWQRIPQKCGFPLHTHECCNTEWKWPCNACRSIGLIVVAATVRISYTWDENGIMDVTFSYFAIACLTLFARGQPKNKFAQCQYDRKHRIDRM